MSIFDENLPITENFLINLGFKRYRKGYYEKDYAILPNCSSKYIASTVVNVMFSLKNNNMYVEKTTEWERYHYHKHKVSDQLDFYAILSKYSL